MHSSLASSSGMQSVGCSGGVEHHHCIGPLVPLKGTLNASAYQNMLHNFMLPTLRERSDLKCAFGIIIKKNVFVPINTLLHLVESFPRGVELLKLASVCLYERGGIRSSLVTCKQSLNSAFWPSVFHFSTVRPHRQFPLTCCQSVWSSKEKLKP